jgi:hypothetical protein
MTSKDSYLHNWVFHFNPYKQIWSAIPRDLYNSYWNNENVEGVYSSTDIKTLLEALHKTDGNLKNLNYERT